jgi:iron complex outermembrane receptor protein
MRLKKNVLALSTALACASTVPLQPALAQEPSGDEMDVLLEEVIVTARKREESLQEIPVAITAFGAQEIASQDIRDLESVADYTPGFQFQNQGNQQPGRYNTQLQFRGLTTAQFSPSFATGALFIDGIYVLNGGTSLGLMDVERVEVIKGPQSAYFGRNTFGGAVNIITRDPNMATFAGEAMVRFTDRSNNEINAIIEGPIIKDVLSFSLSGRYYDKEGHYTATDGGRTGDEQTSTFNGVVKWNATDALEFKLRYAYSEDDDGPPSQAFVSGLLNDTCSGLTIDSPEGTVMPRNYICGTVPYGDAVNVDPGAGVISSNTFLPQYVIDTGLTDPATNIPGLPQVDDVGLLRETTRWSFFGGYTFDNGSSIDFNYGSNEQKANWIRDFDLSDRISWFSRDPQFLEDESYEIRFTSPQDQRFRWLVGYNYYEQEFTSSGGGGDATTSCFAAAQVPLSDNYPADCIGGVPGIVNLLFRNSLAGSDEAEVQGIFGAIDFDITDSITAIIEGRWQEDKFRKGASTFADSPNVISETFDDFLPRVILRWTPTDGTNLYASYSEGQIAGDFNTFFINADERERAQYLAQDSRIQEALDAETLEAWEIGWKQALAGGRGQLNLAAYYYTWENIKGRSSFLINETCRSGDIGTPECDPANGIGVGDPKQIPGPDGELTPFFNARNTLLPGDATIMGLEAEFLWAFTENLLFQLNYAYIDSEYDDYEFNFVRPIAGFAQMRGNQTPRQPKHSGNTALTWNYDLFNNPSYLRGDAFYQGEAFVDESNLAKISDYWLVNLRTGMDFGEHVTLELFVTNLFDEEAWATGARWTDFSSPTQFPFLTAKQGVAVSPLDKREYGVRAFFRF